MVIFHSYVSLPEGARCYKDDMGSILKVINIEDLTMT